MVEREGGVEAWLTLLTFVGLCVCFVSGMNNQGTSVSSRARPIEPAQSRPTETMDTPPAKRFKSFFTVETKESKVQAEEKTIIDLSETKEDESEQGEWLRNELRQQMTLLHASQPDLCCFGKPEAYQRPSAKSNSKSTSLIRAVRLRLPLERSAPRDNSWFRLIDSAIINKLANNPTDRDMCWLVRLPEFGTKLTNEKKRAKKKVQKDPYAGGAKVSITLGSGATQSVSTWKLHRLVHAMYNPDMFPIIGEFDVPDDVHLAHRCGLGGRGFPWEEYRDHVCINPFHVRYLYETQNYDEKFCRNGHFNLCPHYDQSTPAVRCLWTWRDTGEVKACRLSTTGWLGCTCSRNCFQSPTLERPHQDLTFIKPFPTVSNKAKDDEKKDSEEDEEDVELAE